ncbi:DUF6779 domain-containing protein [Mycolicibacterium goodii]|nr:DUF6779 domain-containing protein [Mycolicibacterium goodii]MBU8837660.1 hypothetical protein [Mycolicibacterium goodii]
MTVPPRGVRPRRGGRRPGWLLLTVLLVLAILASSALVFTNRVELLKLAVILALWAAVVAAFVSVIYRRQSDLDQAKARDLKLVYDLQLDREISARREYELTVETQLRRELASELRAQAADEVAALRAELAALRANLEILFDADLAHRPALETDRNAVRPAGRVTASRLDVPDVETTDIRDFRAEQTEESPIIDVPAEPHPPEDDWGFDRRDAEGGAHRFPSQPTSQPAEEPRRRRRRRLADDDQPPVSRPQAERQPSPPGPPQAPQAPPQAPQAPPQPPPRPLELQAQPTPPPTPQPAPPPSAEPVSAWAPPPPPPSMPPLQPSPTIDGGSSWQPAPAEGQWIPAGAPGSNWAAPVSPRNGASTEYVGRRRAPEPGETHEPAPAAAAEPAAQATPPPGPVPPAMAPPERPERPRGRHYAAGADAENTETGPDDTAPPVLAAEPATPPPPSGQPAPRHRGAEEEPRGQHANGQSAAELLARFQAAPTGGGRRRRRDE